MITIQQLEERVKPADGVCVFDTATDNKWGICEWDEWAQFVHDYGECDYVVFAWQHVHSHVGEIPFQWHSNHMAIAIEAQGELVIQQEESEYDYAYMETEDVAPLLERCLRRLKSRLLIRAANLGQKPLPME